MGFMSFTLLLIIILNVIVFNVYLDAENFSLVFGSPASDNISTLVTT